jgi:hypothetical protein
VSLAAVLIASLVASEEDTRSLAERAAEAASRARRKPASEKTLTNDDLKRAKGNVIFLSATPTAPPPAVAPPSRDVPIAALGALSDQQVAGARLRGAIEEGLRQLAESTPEQRAAIEQRVKNALDELARTHEAIGALTERARLGGTASSE